MSLGPPPTRKGALSPERRRLVELMQEVNFGRIRLFQVRGGEPVLTSSVRVERDVVFGKENANNPARAKTDFALRKEVVELFERFDQEQTLAIRRLEVQNGLPVRMTVVGGL